MISVERTMTLLESIHDPTLNLGCSDATCCALRRSPTTRWSPKISVRNA